MLNLILLIRAELRMTDYRRLYRPGATWFFTVNTAERKGKKLLTEHIEALRAAFRNVRGRHPYTMPANESRSAAPSVTGTMGFTMFTPSYISSGMRS